MSGSLFLLSAQSTFLGGLLTEISASRNVSAAADISSERKAALWLYAWSFMNGAAQRHAASSQLLSARGL
jgi:hypothetical protein